MINNPNYYQYQRPVAMFSMAKAKAGPLTNLAGFGSGVGESFWENHRQKSQGWANASEQVKPPSTSHKIARSLGMTANLAILGSFAYVYIRERRTKNGKVVVERVRKKR